MPPLLSSPASHLAASGSDRRVRLRDIGGELRLGPGPGDIGLPGRPERIGKRLIGVARFGRLIGAREGLDRRLVGADPVDFGGDAELVHHPLVIETRAARPGQDHATQRVEPYLGRVGSELIGAVAVAGGISEHRLAGRAGLVDRLADRRDRCLLPAEKGVEVDHDRLDTVRGRSGGEGALDIAQPGFATNALRARDQSEWIGIRWLLDQRAREIEHKRAAAGNDIVGRDRQCREQQSEEQQHHDQDQQILDPDQQSPEPPKQRHLVMNTRRELDRWPLPQACSCP